MPEPDLLVTKFTAPPVRSVLLHRPHLLRVLDQSRSFHLTLLSASAGFGKTTLHYDGQLGVEMSGKLESFGAVRAEVLLLGGSKSPAYLKVALDALEKILPHVKRIEFPGLGHAAAWNYDRQRNPGGQPESVAQELRRFFAEP